MTIAIIIILAFMAVIALALQGRKKLKSQVISVDKDLCTGCGRCVKQCRKHVLSLTETDGKAHVDVASPEYCTACGRCMVACPMRALRIGEKKVEGF